jgi:DNA-binding NarL/FixJ family response regulator
MLSKEPAESCNDSDWDDLRRNNPVNVLLVDASPLTQMGIRAILNKSRSLKLVGIAHDEHMAAEDISKLSPDVIIVNSVALAQKSFNTLMRTDFHPGQRPRILIIINHTESATAHLENFGAHGFVHMQAQPEEFIAAINLVAAGYSVAAPVSQAEDGARPRRTPVGIGRFVNGTRLDTLTQRELDVLDAVAQGWTNAEIAKKLILSESTVKSHVQSLLTKLDLRNRASAVALAYEAGMLKAETAVG